MPKVIIIGIDGGAYKLIKKWVNELPNICMLIKNGIFGKMDSTIPPLTSPAWNCLYTGKNPGKIGIFDFISYPIQNNKINIVNSSRQEAPSFWELLGIKGYKVGVVNAAVTYPPKPVNGYIVCGFGTPWGKNSFSYPDFISNVLTDKFNYEITSPISLFDPNHEEKYLDLWISVTRKRLDSIKWLIKNHPCDCLFATFFATDSVQHYCWHHIDKMHPRYDSNIAVNYEDYIKKIYIEVDSAIGELIKELDGDGHMFIVSDHGFHSCYGTFNINRWLEANGFLKFKQGMKIKNNHLIKLKNIVLSHISENLANKIVKHIPERILKLVQHDANKKNIIEGMLSAIDWENTLAYAIGNMGQIFINISGKDKNGIVDPSDYEDIRDSIISKLQEVKDPLFGRYVFNRIYKREDIYAGKYLALSPDIIFILDNYMQTIDTNTIWNNDPVLSGTHDMDAIFIGFGKGIKRGVDINNVSIYDVAPTILHVFGCPLPEDIDGRVIHEIFDENSIYNTNRIHKVDEQKEALRKKILLIKNSCKLA